ncbi:MAG: YceH family protein [bacterium]
MDQLLNEADVRILGALVEKQITTPDYYPLSLNALTAACNQLSNRQPIVSYDEETVLAAVHRLRQLSLVRALQRTDSRVTKYQHLFGEGMDLTESEIAVMCVLMLRGPQTVGELRTRTERLAYFEKLSQVETTLHALLAHTPSPLVFMLPRQPGQKEIRYAHLLSGPVTFDTTDAPDTQTPVASAFMNDRIAALEEATQELRNEVADVRRQLDEFRKQFE